MKSILKKAAVIVCALVLVISAVMPVYADTPAGVTFTITKVAASKAAVAKDEITEIEIEMISSEPVTITEVSRRPGDDFSTGVIKTAPQQTEGTKHVFSFQGLKYDGYDNRFYTRIKYTTASGSNEMADLTANVTECVQENIVIPERPTPDTPCPQALFTREDTLGAIKSGETQEITVSIENVGSTIMSRPVLYVSTSDELALTGQTAIKLSGIYGGGKTTVKIPVKAADVITADNQQLNLELSFTYDSASGTAAGTSTGKIIIPSVKKSESGAPGIVAGEFDYGGSPVSAGKSFTLDVDFKNTSKAYKLENIIASINTGSELAINGASNTQYFESLEKGGTGTFSVPVKVSSNPMQSSQNVTLEFRYDYIAGGKRVTDTSSFTVAIPCRLNGASSPEGTAIPTPYVIVESYAYGGEPVAAGEEFDLGITFKNTSSAAPIENVVVTVSSGADLILNGSGNTFYFTKVAAGGRNTITVPYKLVKNILTSAEPITLDFKYEYIDAGQRNSVSNTLNITVPCYMPDKLEISEPKFEYEPTAMMESMFTIEYVNKGNSPVTNLEMTLEGDLESVTPYQRIGTVDAGKSGMTAFAVTPMIEGENSFKVIINYEDANGTLKERVFEQKVYAYPAPIYEPDEPWDEPIDEPGTTLPGWVIPAIIAACVIAAIVVLVILRKKSKLKKEKAKWEDLDLDKELES